MPSPKRKESVALSGQSDSRPSRTWTRVTESRNGVPGAPTDEAISDVGALRMTSRSLTMSTAHGSTASRQQHDSQSSDSTKGRTHQVEGMLSEGRHFAKLAPNIFVKIPMSEDGLEAIARLALGSRPIAP